jgi:hypothetical protein
MGSLYCNNCHSFGMYWVGLGGMNEHTYCPNCGHINCQQTDEYEEECENDES